MMDNSKKILNQYGPIVLFGSGETLPASGKAYEIIAKSLGKQLQISILETPAGFQPNTEIVAKKVSDFISTRLQNYAPSIQLIPARSTNSNYSPNNIEIVDKMLLSNWIFMGPGSPTYTIRQLQNSLALDYLYALNQTGAALTLSSAGVLAMSALTLPVYEIYKVGEEIHWKNGLNYFSQFGSELVLIPHWNNKDGGTELDTSRCFMGTKRFEILREMLPENMPIIGIDEQTALIFQFKPEPKVKITGKGSVKSIVGTKEKVFPPGEYQLTDLGTSFNKDFEERKKLKEIKEKILTLRSEKTMAPGKHIIQLANYRLKARNEGDWKTADDFRNKIEAEGWTIQDTSESYLLVPKVP